MSMRHFATASLAGLIALVQSGPLLAQNTTPDAENAGPSSADIGGDDIIVTAQRRAETLERTPVAVSAISSETLARQAIVTQSDLQIAVPGLTVKAGQSSNQLNYSLRGQTVDSFSSSRPSVLPYVNEVQVGGSSATALFDLQSVQVLKGPQGTLFGRNSTGGAVLFTTTKPTNELGGYATLRGGNYNHLQAEGAVNVPIVDDSVLLRVAGFVQRRSGFQFNLFDNERLGKVRRENIRGSLTIKEGGITNDLVIDYGHSGGENISSVVYNVLPLGVGAPFVPNNFIYSPAADSAFGAGFFASFLAAHPGADPEGIIAFADKQKARGPFKISVDSPNFHRSKTLFVSNITTINLGPDTQLRNIIGLVRHRAQDTSEFDGTPFPANTNGPEGRGGILRQFSEELQLVGKAFDSQLSYVGGLYYTKERDHQRSITVLLDLLPLAPPIRQVNDGTTRNRTIAGYAQGTLDLGRITGVEGLGFTLGARYSSEKVTFRHQADDAYLTSPNPAFVNPLSDTFNKFSWQIGLQHQVNANLLLYGVSRRSFRSGGFNFFAPPLPGFGNDGGSEYKPETATDVELGVKYRGDIGMVPVRVNLAAYNMWIDDIQRSNYVSIFGSLAGITVNVPKAEVTGFELDGSISPASWLNLGGNINYTKARFTSNLVSVLGNPAVAFGPYPDTPKWSGAAYAEAFVPLSSNLRGSIRGDVYAQTSFNFSSTGNTLNPGTKVSGYTLANFRVGIEDTRAGWSVAGLVKNAFDRTYYVGGIGFASLLALNTVIPGDPRTWLIEASFKF